MITTNTGAKKLESSDNWREIFPNPGTGTAGAHNATVDAQDRIQAEVAPIINGKRCSLGAASGDYVLLRNSTIAGKTDGAYQAAKAIPANTDLDSTYLGSAITGGIVNELNSNLTQVDYSSVMGLRCTKTGTIASVLLNASGNFVTISADGKTLDQIIPTNFRPQRDMRLSGKVYDGSSYVDCMTTINADGQIIITNFFGNVITGVNPRFIDPAILVYQIG